MKEFRYQLKKIMEIRGINQSELCEKTGIPKSAISQYVSGAFRPKQERTYLLSEALRTTPEFLMGLTDNPDPDSKEKPPSSDVREQLETICDTMPEDMQRELLKYAKYLTMQQSPEIEIVEQTTIGAEIDRRAATDAEAEKTAV